MQGLFTVSAGELASAVKYAARWLDPKPVEPIHAGLLFEVGEGQLTVSGFNDDTTARAAMTVAEDSKAEGAFVVSGRLADALLATLTTGQVTFEQQGDTVHVECGRFRGTLPSMPENDYPKLAGQAALAGRVTGADLADVIARVASAASTDTSKQVQLTGVHLSFGESGDPLTFMATNTYRAARQDLAWIPDDDGAPYGGQALVPAQALIDAADGFATSLESVEIGWEEGVFSLTTPARSLVTRTLDLKGFPAPDLVTIFAGEPPARATLRPKDLLLPLKRAEVMTGREVDNVTLTFDGTMVAITARGQSGSGDDAAPASLEGAETATMALRTEALRTALTAAPGDTVTLSFTPGTTKPVIFTSPANPTWKYLVVPLRK